MSAHQHNMLIIESLGLDRSVSFKHINAKVEIQHRVDT